MSDDPFARDIQRAVDAMERLREADINTLTEAEYALYEEVMGLQNYIYAVELERRGK